MSDIEKPSTQRTSYDKKDVRGAVFNIAGTFGLGCLMINVVIALLAGLVFYLIIQTL